MDTLLSERLWLSKNVSWTDVRRNLPVSSLPQQILTTSLVFLAFRLIIDCLVFLPLARRQRVVPNKSLFVLWSLHIGGEQLDVKNQFKKVSEGTWKLLFFIGFSIAGIVLMNIEGLWAVSDCLRGWPAHVVHLWTHQYLLFETSFRVSILLSSVLYDVRRRDFPQSLLHHVLTVTLLALCFAMNLLRIAVPVLVAHNIADVFLESAQLARLLQRERALRTLFLCALVSWVVTRLFYFPFWILHCAFFDAPLHLKAEDGFWSTAPVYRLLVLMLSLLAGLHLFWSLILLKVTLKYCNTGSLKDLRDKTHCTKKVL